MLRLIPCCMILLVTGLCTSMTGCKKEVKTFPMQVNLKFPSNMKLAKDDNIEVQFTNVDDPQSGFVASGPFSEMPFTANAIAGSFKVQLKIEPYPGSEGSEKRVLNYEMLNRSFDSVETPLKIDLTEGPNQTITIDIGKKTISK